MMIYSPRGFSVEHIELGLSVKFQVNLNYDEKGRVLLKIEFIILIIVLI